ncbi:MAG: T9SS type A sorting domain-containing protein [Bacteroidales bacterium]|nr:T9SS type A sorting domain-containing protein [Bacteroidales bacterium]
MKKIGLLVLFSLSLLLFTLSSYAQNVTFNYDESGNRITRLIVNKELKETLADTILPETSIKLANQQLENLTIAVYPNPTTDNIHIVFAGLVGDASAEGYLYSMNAELLASFKLIDSNSTIEMQQYTAGIYFLKVRKNNKVESWKIIKQ